MKDGLKLTWWQVIILVMSIGGAFFTANAQQNKNVDNKTKEIKVAQEKKNEKYDEKFEKVIDAITKTNLKLERVVALLEK